MSQSNPSLAAKTHVQNKYKEKNTVKNIHILKSAMRWSKTFNL